MSSGKIILKINELSVTETAVNKSRMVSYPDVQEGKLSRTPASSCTRSQDLEIKGTYVIGRNRDS